MKTKNFSLNNPLWRDSLPRPVFDEKPEYNELYLKAWELARDHVREIDGLPQTPYMDEAFCKTQIWIWDTCFMTLFCKYAPDVFPGIESLNNFYRPLFDGVPLPMVEPPPDEPEWTGAKGKALAPLMVHIADNPPLFAWAEYQYAMMTGDMDHIRDLLLNKQYLQKSFDFFEKLTETICPNGVLTPTCAVKRPKGYYWEGGRSGMDNTPRGRKGTKSDRERPAEPHTLWIDLAAQQALSAFCIARLAKRADLDELADSWMKKYEEFKALINTCYWDDADGCYYDLNEDDMSFVKVLTPASFWPLLSRIPTQEQAERLCSFLRDPNKLGGKVPWVTLARDDADFNAETGHYWRGSVWLPTAYMGLKALETYGQFSLANKTARDLLEHMYQTYKNCEPHTIWECYAPNNPLPAKHGDVLVRKDFCGWSALGPIAIYLENVIGIHSIDAFAGRVFWHLPETVKGRIGVCNLSFGDTCCDLIYADGKLNGVSNRPFTLNLNGQDYPIPAGRSELSVK